MKNKYKFCLILVVFIFSCSNSELKLNDGKTILLERTGDIQPMSSFISELDYIMLNSPENNLAIGQIENLKFLDNDIIVKQSMGKQKSLLRFSADGMLLNEIGNTAEGAGQIVNPRDIIMYNDDYAVWDQSGVYVFSKSGEYQRKLFDADRPGNRFFYSQNKFYLFHETTAPGYISEYSTSGTPEHIYKPNRLQHTGLGYSGVSEIANDSFHLFSPINDTIYSFSQKQLVPRYIIYGKSHPTFIQLLNKAGSRDSVERQRFINNNRHWVVKQYLENKNFIFITYRLGSNPFILLIRKADGKTIYCKELINDIDGGVWDDPVYLSDDDKLYIPLNAYQITGHKMKNKKRHGFDAQMEKAQQNNNPVVMVCKLK